MPRPYNVLFLCTANSARSIMSEAILNRLGRGKFKAYSAGSAPSGKIHPHTLALLGRLGYDTGEFRSKSWQEFVAPGAPEFDFVFVICDEAAREAFPVWPGQPVTAYWNIPDPAAVIRDEPSMARAFLDAYAGLAHRLALFAALPLARLDRLSLNKRLEQIGRVYAA
jgi:protein-tyrosine-phosphatase